MIRDHTPMTTRTNDRFFSSIPPWQIPVNLTPMSSVRSVVSGCFQTSLDLR